MNISITPELEGFVDEEVKAGLYQSASEVIRPGSPLKGGQGAQAPFHGVLEGRTRRQAARRHCRVGPGEGMPGGKVFAELKAHSAKQRRAHA